MYSKRYYCPKCKKTLDYGEYEEHILEEHAELHGSFQYEKEE